jgi:hypothetical protein
VNAGNFSNSDGVRGAASRMSAAARLRTVFGDGDGGLFMQVKPAGHDAEPKW